MGRLHHLKETIFQNIEDNSDYEDIEYVLLDYNSPDGLEAWVLENSAKLKKVVYFKEHTVTRWRMPHAKNLAHLLSTGDIVCNLDADNCTGKGFATIVAKKFADHPDSIITHFHGGGFGGRIALRRTDFRRLRGYDEQLSWGWGWEDDDLKARAEGIGLKLDKIWMPDDRAIGHDNSERIKYMPEWKTVEEAHSRQGDIFLKRQPGAIINPGGYGKGIVSKLMDKTAFLVSDTIAMR
jgi:hypothetical protein